LTNSAKTGERNYDPWLETDGNCHYYVVYGRQLDGYPIIRRSKDFAASWSQPLRIPWKTCDRPVLGKRFPVIVLDGAGGLHVAYVIAGAKKLLIQSSADWKTWKYGAMLSNDTIDEVRMAAIDACGPMVHVTWMERIGNIWQAYYRGSRNSGATWSPPLCLSNAIELSDASIANGFLIYGDDDQSSVRDDGLGRVHAVWSDRGGRIAHAIVDWSSKIDDGEQTNALETSAQSVSNLPSTPRTP
jgi:hypothetical protein